MADRVMRHGVVAGLPARWREADGAGAPLIVLLHGLTGDETVMWVFEPILPSEALVVAPRAPFPFPGGGYSWVDPLRGPMPAVSGFASAAQAVARAVDEVQQSGHDRALVLMGFSQGAAVAVSGAALNILHPRALVALAGVVPPGDLPGLRSLPIYWAHGKQDEVVPVEQARADVQRLRLAGASVTYCEADVGHKLGAECMKGLRPWLAGLPSDMPPRGA